MGLELYDDRVFFSIWNAEAQKIEEKELYDERCEGGPSHKTQINRLVSYWCEWCECAFQKKDVPNTFPHDPNCPVCGKQLVEFDLDNIAPEWDMDIAQDAEGNWVPKDDLEL